jgi:hypothetical protein
VETVTNVPLSCKVERLLTDLSIDSFLIKIFFPLCLVR